MTIVALVVTAAARDEGGCDLGGVVDGGGGGGGGGPSGPTAAALCEQSGGAWGGDECACAQDGATLHNEFVAGVGCRFPDDSDLIEDLETLPLYEAIAEYFAVGRTVYLIDRPGAFDVVHPM